jgi:hypothetical protein
MMAELLEWAQTRIREASGPWTRVKDTLETIGGVSLSVGGVGVGVNRNETVSDKHFSPTLIAKALSDLSIEIQKDNQQGGIMLLIDEIQAAAPTDMTLLAAILHQLNFGFSKAPVVFAATGLPSTIDVLYDAGVTHPDRLFNFEMLPLTLTPQEATYAIVEPANQMGVVWEPEAAAEIVAATNGHPAHLQLFANATWVCATGSIITLEDAGQGIVVATRQLEQQTLEPRWRRFTDRQREFLAALAVNGGRTTTSTVANTLGKTIQQISMTRDELMKEGILNSPRYGELEISVPTMIPYILKNYEQARFEASTELQSIDEMKSIS